MRSYVVTRRSGISDTGLYADLPVLLVDEWSDITEELLQATKSEFDRKDKQGVWNWGKLQSSYWRETFVRVASASEPM